MTLMRHDRVEINSRRYEIFLNGRLRYHMYREAMHPFFWLLEHPDGTILDRDQYQNDLLERIDNFRYEPDPVFSERSEAVDAAHREINPSWPYLRDDVHERCFHCSAYIDECQCDGGLGQ